MDIIKNLLLYVHWKFAKTMPNIPHWYIVRWDYPELDSEFVELVKFIRERGEEREFQGVKYIYLDLGGWMLWTEGDPIHDDPNEAQEALSQGNNTTFKLNAAHKDGLSPDKADPNNYLNCMTNEDLFYYLTAFLR